MLEWCNTDSNMCPCKDTHFLNINEHIKTLSTTELTKLNQHLRKK